VGSLVDQQVVGGLVHQQVVGGLDTQAQLEALPASQAWLLAPLLARSHLPTTNLILTSVINFLLTEQQPNFYHYT